MEDQEFKHVCKFCRKSFPCGRSLGGHMRSHMMKNNNSAETDEKFSKKMLVSSANNGKTGLEAACINGGYILVRKPKKTWRLALFDKVCKDCGKGFQSWKALLGHMKCHSDKEKASNNSLDDQDSWTGFNMDSQSDNETAVPSKKRRSKRKTRYKVAPANSLNNQASSSMSEIQQEEEEVALSLMMLSRDVGHWVGFNFVAESSDNKSLFFEAESEIKASISNGGKVQKVKNLESATVGYESFKNGVFDSQVLEKSSKRKLKDQSQEDELKSDSVDKLAAAYVVESEICRDPHKRSKFECTTCNKIFHSYRALGGHRASHNRINGGTENAIETDTKPVSGTPMADIVAEDSDDKKSKGHECPICLKVFPSGPVLGGHKRSHFLTDAKQNLKIEIQKPIQEIREFPDLNLPAPVEEETTMGFKQWWV